MLEKLLTQKLLSLLGVASVMALIAALGLTTYLTGQETRVPTGAVTAEADDISLSVTQTEFPEYQASYTFNAELCNISAAGFSASLSTRESSPYINNIAGGIGSQIIEAGGCRTTTFTVYMANTWTQPETRGTTTQARVVANTEICSHGCLEQTLTFGTAAATPTLSPTPTLTPVPNPDCGDVNCDGEVNMNDVTSLQRYITYPNQPICGYLEWWMWTADVNCSGSIDMGDVGRLQGYVDNPNQFPLNCCSGTPTPTPTLTVTPTPSGKPDLICFDITLDPASPIVGQKVKFGYTYANIGNASAGNNLHQLFVDNQKIYEGNAVGLRDMETRTTAPAIPLEGWTATAGSHTAKIKVDAEVNPGQDAVDESNENNNECTKSFTVGAAPTPTPTPGDSCKEYGDDWVCWLAPGVCPGETRTPPSNTCCIDTMCSTTCCYYPSCPTLAAPENVQIQTVRPMAANAFLAFVNEADINGDGTIDGADASVLVSSWGKSRGEAGYNSDADLNNDEKVNAVDASILVSNWSE